MVSNTRNITKNQVDYIKILTSYESTKMLDERDIIDFLQVHKKGAVELLNMAEASELIGVLLQRPVNYCFPCGKVASITKQDYNKYEVFGGPVEACLHECEIDIYDCKYYVGNGNNL